MSPGESVAVYGGGPVGLMAAYSALLRGASRVFVVDRVSEAPGLYVPSDPGAPDEHAKRGMLLVSAGRPFEKGLCMGTGSATGGDGTEIPTRTVVWCVGVRPVPLVEAVGLPIREGRVVVDGRLGVSGHRDVYAAGDVAAVPDPGRPGEITTMTGRHHHDPRLPVVIVPVPAPSGRPMGRPPAAATGCRRTA